MDTQTQFTDFIVIGIENAANDANRRLIFGVWDRNPFDETTKKNISGAKAHLRLPAEFIIDRPIKARRHIDAGIPFGYKLSFSPKSVMPLLQHSARVHRGVISACIERPNSDEADKNLGPCGTPHRILLYPRPEIIG